MNESVHMNKQYDIPPRIYLIHKITIGLKFMADIN